MAASPTTTSFLPPNPEDGELWLPSYLRHEIAFPNAKPNNNTTRTSTTTPLPSPRPHAPNKKQDRDTLLGVKPNVKTTIGNGQPCVDHPYNYPFLNSPLQFVPGPLYPPNPITSPNQFLGYNCKKSSGKSEGTGVFLPGPARKSTKKEDNVGKIKGTGVFLNHQVMVKPKKGGANGKGGSEKKTSLKEEIRAKTQDPSDQIRLPQDWSY